MLKRVALLLGYSGKDEKGSHLSAVERDLYAYEKFLMSPKGGLWESNEIIKMIDEELEDLPQKYILHKNKCDFLYVVYSGHGYYDNCQHLGLNKDNYTLTNKYFENWASRQICVFDACAKILKNEGKNELLLEKLSKRLYTINPDKRRELREKYENQIMQRPKQAISLYAASPDEYARATSLKSYYIGALLRELNYVEEDIDIMEAHEIAKEEVIKRSDYKQHPCSVISPKDVKEYLPGAINDLF